jgi:hypothetical protein
MPFSYYLQRYFKFMARQTSAVVFQLSCSEQRAVLNCSLGTQRNVLRSCILAQQFIADQAIVAVNKNVYIIHQATI